MIKLYNISSATDAEVLFGIAPDRAIVLREMLRKAFVRADQEEEFDIGAELVEAYSYCKDVNEQGFVTFTLARAYQRHTTRPPLYIRRLMRAVVDKISEENENNSRDPLDDLLSGLGIDKSKE